MIFSSQLLHKDSGTLQRFKSLCISSDYAASLVDKAIKKLRHCKAEVTPQLPEQNEEEAIDLMKKLLRVNPDDRITADEAIKHDYVIKFFNPSIEDKVKKFIVQPPIDDDKQLSIDEYRQKLYEIIKSDKHHR